MKDAQDKRLWPEPRENPDLVGHEAAEQAFAASLRSGRLPHAWLICGTEGIGKATLAFRLARHLLSGASGGPNAGGLFGGDGLYMDPEHPVFRRVAAGGHADLMTVVPTPDPETKKMRTVIAVDDVRRVNDFLHMTPAEGGYRVVVVDSVDLLNRHSANALLKILEEPPPQAVLLLVCHAPGRVIATIRSRCRKLALRPLEDTQVAKLLARYLPELEDAERAALVGLAEGSPGRALQLAEAGGLDLYREMIAVIAGGQGAALQKFCERAARADEAFRAVTRLFLWWLARAVRLAARGDGRNGAIVAGEEKALARISAGGLDRFVELWEKAGRLFARAESVNLDRKQVMMSAFLALETAAKP